MKHSFFLSITADNALRVLQRITTVLARHRINIEQLTVFETKFKGVSHFSIGIYVEENLVNKVVKQLQRIIEVQEIHLRKMHAYEHAA